VGNEPVKPFASLDQSRFRSADHWIVNRLADAIASCNAALGPAKPPKGAWAVNERNVGLRLDEYAESARRFVWNELADWYVEACKQRLMTPGDDREIARAILVHMFDQSLRLLHPIMPFVTEALWKRLPATPANAFLATSAWPVAPKRHGAETNGADSFPRLVDVISAVREVRNEYMIPPTAELSLFIAGPAQLTAAVAGESELVMRLAKASVSVGAPGAGGAAHRVLPLGLEVTIPLAGIVDFAKEREKLSTELAGLTKQLEGLRGRLSNEKFTAKAPPEIVAAERKKEGEWAARAEQLKAKIAGMGS
jgi:valyl-tRNA synthetase